MGLGVSAISFTAGAPAKSADVNNNFSNVDGATSPSFNGVSQNASVSEVGSCGGNWPGSGGSSQAIGPNVNFKTTMINTPSSVTLTSSFTANIAAGPTANDMAKTGFNMYWTPSSTGSATYWLGTYSTNGNCLLEHHPGPDTFHHHCDVCGQFNLHVPLKALLIHTWHGEAPGLIGLSYRCPQCEARRTDEDRKWGKGEVIECWNTGHTSAEEDPAFALEHPGRHLQVQVIRAVMQTLGLPVYA